MGKNQDGALLEGCSWEIPFESACDYLKISSELGSSGYQSVN